MRLPTIPALLSLALALPTIARAAGSHPWAGIHGGWSTYTMYDVNKDIGNINAVIAAVGQYAVRGPGASGAHFGASLGMVSSAGSVTVAVSGVGSASGDLKGSGPLFEGYVGGDRWASPSLALMGSAGCRYARISEIKLDDQIVYLTPGGKEALDYGGLFVRVGLRVELAR